MYSFSQWTRKKRMQYMNIINDLSEEDENHPSKFRGSRNSLNKFKQLLGGGGSSESELVIKKNPGRKGRAGAHAAAGWWKGKKMPPRRAVFDRSSLSKKEAKDLTKRATKPKPY